MNTTSKQSKNTYVTTTELRILKMLMPVGMSYRMIAHQYPDQDLSLRQLNESVANLKRQELITVNAIGYHIISEKGRDILYKQG